MLDVGGAAHKSIAAFARAHHVSAPHHVSVTRRSSVATSHHIPVTANGHHHPLGHAGPVSSFTFIKYHIINVSMLFVSACDCRPSKALDAVSTHIRLYMNSAQRALTIRPPYVSHKLTHPTPPPQLTFAHSPPGRPCAQATAAPCLVRSKAARQMPASWTHARIRRRRSKVASTAGDTVHDLVC